MLVVGACMRGNNEKYYIKTVRDIIKGVEGKKNLAKSDGGHGHSCIRGKGKFKMKED